MNKRELFTFKGVNQDVSKGKHPKEFYYEGNNIRISSTDSQSTGAVSNEKGTVLALTVPTPFVNVSTGNISYGNKTLKFLNQEIRDQYTGKTSGTQKIIGHTIARDNIILFTTDDNGFDCIWEITESNDVFDITLLYLRNLGFTINSPIQAIFNFENNRIQKVYWVDGKTQLRFLNTRHSKENENNENLIDVNSNTINIVGNFSISQPTVSEIVPGGNHTAGMIQYAYNLYRLNSSQTKLSPLSALIPLTKGSNQGGGAVNEVVGSTPVVNITGLDPEYTHIKVYAIKYTSYNATPTISLIKEQEIGSSKEITIFDDGNIINDVSTAEFLFLGSDPIIPKHIESKDNILFSANIEEQNFDIKLDTRAYAFPLNSPTTIVYEDIKKIGNSIRGIAKSISNTYSLVTKHDSINLKYDTNKYQYNSSVLGGEGKNVKYEIIQDTTVVNPETKQFLKDNEVYRLGIQFYNRLGQKSLPKWVADFKAPEGNLEGKYNTLKVSLTSDFYVWLNTSSNFKSENDKPVGYRVLRANRTLNDRTIITQGFMNAMMSTIVSKSTVDSLPYAERKRQAEDGEKMPSLQRVFGKHSAQMEGMEHYKSLSTDPTNLKTSEVCTAKGGDGHIANTWQYTTIMQMFSPEVMFSNVPLYEGLELRIKGANENKSNYFWGQEREIANKNVFREGKVKNGLTPHDPGIETTDIGDINALCDTGIFGPADRDSDGDPGTTMDFLQFYRDFTKSYIPSTNSVIEGVYGKPELTEKGQGPVTYNNNPDFRYYNSLEPMITDWVDWKDGNNRRKTPGLTSVNSWGAKCITLMLGAANLNLDDRPKLEKLFQRTGIAETNVMLVGELVKNQYQIYLGGLYGGNTFEDRKRTNYIEIGNYVDINTSSVYIDSPGDTFVQNYRYSKIVKTDTETYSAYTSQITEIVEGKIETSIDLRNRNDLSKIGWDSRFQPRYDEYHEYNRVYSQQPTLLQTQDVDFNFRKVNNFDTRIMASKIKVPGENIDNWTDLLVNEVQDLNGKYGPINSLVSFRDNIFALQDKAIAAISINPRVQVQGSDGISVELGSGSILHDYKYVTTNSGTLNKWGVCTTQFAIYYVDTINKCFNRFSNGIEKLSDVHGLHTWFQTKIDYATIRADNPYLNKGVHIGYDLVNNSILLTINQENPYTRLFNESSNSFIGLMDYKPSSYIVNNSRLFSIDSEDSYIHEHFKGKYNHFYGKYYPSYITLLVNPNVHAECTFDNIEYNSEMYLNDIDVSDKTFTSIEAWNEYQASGEVPLVLGRSTNLRRKFRAWRADIPRQGRQRMKNPWIYLKLSLDNEEDYKMILHDIIVDYTVN